MKDMHNCIGLVMLKEPMDAVHADVASAWLDRKGFEAVEISAIIGVLTGVDASNYVTPVLQESDTTAATDASAVASTDMLGAFTKVDSTTEDSVIQKVGYVGKKRYIRVNFDYTGTGISAGIVGAVGLVCHAAHEPVTTPSPVAAT